MVPALLTCSLEKVTLPVPVSLTVPVLVSEPPVIRSVPVSTAVPPTVTEPAPDTVVPDSVSMSARRLGDGAGIADMLAGEGDVAGAGLAHRAGIGQ